MTRGLVAIACCALASACASALREPPTVAELAGSAATRTSASEVDRLLGDAERSYSQGTLESVRDATRFWLEAAAADEDRIEGLIGASRGNVWLSGKEPVDDQRRMAAESAVQSAQLCSEAAPDNAACRYWLAVALGVQARERRSTALDALPKMVELLESTAETDPELEHGGPDRVLALVLLRAPGWPKGPGDPETGLEHARRAVALDPDYPPNQLCLAEALAENDEDAASRQAYAKAAGLARQWVEAGDPEAVDWLKDAEGRKKP